MARKRGRPIIDLTGQQYGRLTPLGLAARSRKGRVRWLCQCSCGSPPVVVEARLLRNGHTTSCGCLQAEAARRSVKTARAAHQANHPRRTG